MDFVNSWWVLVPSGLLGSFIIFSVVSHFYEKQMDFVYQKTPINTRIRKMIENMPYSPTLYLPTAWLKMCSWIPMDTKTKFHREIFTFEDGGEIALDHYPLHFAELKSPILILIPGLNGDTRESPVSYAARRAWEVHGIRSVVYNKRGYAGLVLKGEHVFSWDRDDDFLDVINHLKAKHSNVPVLMMGFSMGANFVQFYLGKCAEKNRSPGIFSCVAVSPPHNFEKGSVKMTRNKLISYLLLKYFVKRIVNDRNNPVLQKLLKHIKLEFDDLRNIKTVREFDDKVSAKVCNLASSGEYYKYVSGVTRLEHVQTPLLCISSENDPLIDHTGMDRIKVEGNSNIFQVVVKNGGHIEYPHGWGNNNWAVMVGLEYLKMQLALAD